MIKQNIIKIRRENNREEENEWKTVRDGPKIKIPEKKEITSKNRFILLNDECEDEDIDKGNKTKKENRRIEENKDWEVYLQNINGLMTNDRDKGMEILKEYG